MACKVVLLVACLAVAQAANLPYYGSGHHAVDYYSPPHYNYQYGVHDAHTGDVKSQEESREGDVVRGSYSLNEADGTRRVVHYTADGHNGFNAVVQREGHAAHPSHAVVAPHGYGYAGHGYGYAAPAHYNYNHGSASSYANARSVHHSSHAYPVGNHYNNHYNGHYGYNGYHY